MAPKFIFIPADDVPVNITPPVISGSHVRNTAHSCSTGTWTNSPTSFSYQWVLLPSTNVGTNSPNYTPTVNGFYVCYVTATNAAGSSIPEPSNTYEIVTGVPAITLNPTMQGFGNPPGNLTFQLSSAATASNGGSITYDWRTSTTSFSPGGFLSGSTIDTGIGPFVYNQVEGPFQRQYACRITATNAAGSSFVQANPGIKNPPQSPWNP